MRRESQNAVQELSGMKYVVARWWEKERRVLDNNVSPLPSHSCSEEVTASSLVHLIVNSPIPVIADGKCCIESDNSCVLCDKSLDPM